MITYEDRTWGNSIIDSLRNEVNELTEKHWLTDECKPIFFISLLFDRNIRDNKSDQYILLTCKHLSSVFSRVLFPIEDNFYGYESVLKAMESLYNQTM